MKTTPELIQMATTYWSAHKLTPSMPESQYIYHLVKFAEQALKAKPAPRAKKEFEPPILEMVSIFFVNNGYTKESAKKFFDYYESNKWKDSRNVQIKNWQMKARAVWFKPENKISDYNSNKNRMTY